MAAPTISTDAWLAAIREIIRQELAAVVYYFRICEYKVISSNLQLQTVDALPVSTSAGLPPIQGYPLRSGVPGGSSQPAPGSSLAVVFLDGNPAKPVVLGGYSSDGALNLTFNTGTGTAEHLTTIEAVCNLLAQLGPLTAGGAGWTEANVDAALALVAAGTSILPTTLAAIKAALAAKSPNLTGLQPSVGCPNLQGG
jgi:hypothetical protein